MQLEDLPARILTLGVLPTVNKICLTNSALWVYALPLHETIFAVRIPREAYQEIAGRAIAAGLAVNTGMLAIHFFNSELLTLIVVTVLSQPQHTTPHRIKVTETMQAFLVHIYFISDMFDHTYFQVQITTTSQL